MVDSNEVQILRVKCWKCKRVTELSIEAYEEGEELERAYRCESMARKRARTLCGMLLSVKYHRGEQKWKAQKPCSPAKSGPKGGG